MTLRQARPEVSRPAKILRPTPCTKEVIHSNEQAWEDSKAFHQAQRSAKAAEAAEARLLTLEKKLPALPAAAHEAEPASLPTLITQANVARRHLTEPAVSPVIACTPAASSGAARGREKPFRYEQVRHPRICVAARLPRAEGSTHPTALSQVPRGQTRKGGPLPLRTGASQRPTT